MTLEFNIFDIYEQPNIDSNEVQDINLIEKIHEERDITSLSISDPLEVPSMMNNYFLRRYNFDGTTQFMNYINDAHYSYVAEWILKKKVFKCTKNKKKFIPISKPRYSSSNLYPRISSMHFRNLRKLS